MKIVRRNRRRRVVLGILSVLSLITVVFIVLFSDILTVRSIECRNESSITCSPEIVAELERLIGQRILLLRLNDLERKIMQSDPAVKSINLSIDVRERSILASVVRRNPVVRIAASNSLDVSHVIDEEGMVFENGTTKDAPPLIIWDGFSTLSIGQRVPDQLGRSVTLIRQLPAIIEVLGAVHVRADSLEVTTVEGTLVTFSLEQDPATQLAALQLVINQSRIDRMIYRSIDLRYQRPIVTK